MAATMRKIADQGPAQGDEIEVLEQDGKISFSIDDNARLKRLNKTRIFWENVFAYLKKRQLKAA
jgi:hypothetical protein